MPINYCKTTCPLDCFDCCSLQVAVNEKGEVLSIEGNKEHPITQGFICEKGRKHKERVHHPSRLKYPMLKEAGEWKRITWEEALDIIASRLRQYIDQSGTKSIGLYSYAGAAGILKNIEDLFFDYLGSTTQVYGSICCGAGAAAQKADFGRVLGHTPEDAANSRNIIIWGRNPVETNIHLVPFVKAARERGAGIILVDPLRTATASICDMHIPVKPEGDAALACAITKYVVENDLYDKEFAVKCTIGFEEIKSLLGGIKMEELLELSGVGMEEVRLLGDKLALEKPSAIYIGFGLQRYPYGGAAVRCIDMLSALTGNIGLPGGGANYSNSASDGYLNMNPFSVIAMERRMINRAKFGRTVKELKDPPLRMLFISRANPVLQLPNTNEVIEAMEQVEFKVSIEHFLTDTAQMADIVLPATYFLEEEDVAVPGIWSDCLGYMHKSLERYYEARPEYEIYTELAERLGLTKFPRLSGEQWLELMLEPMVAQGLQLEDLKAKGFAKNPLAKTVPWEDMQFATASGKFEIIPAAELEVCLKHLMEEQQEKYRLLTVHSRKTLHSQHMLDSKESLPKLHINAADASGEGINTGDVVKLYNGYGTLEAEAVISDSAERGILYMNEGWWLKNGGSVNRLTPDGISDIGNQGIMNHCFCDILKVRRN